MESVTAWTKSLMVYFIKLSADKCVSVPTDVPCCCGGIDQSTPQLLRGCVFRDFLFLVTFLEVPQASRRGQMATVLQLSRGPPNGSPIRSVRHRV